MVAEETRADFERLNERLAEAGLGPFKLALVPIEQLELAPKNARYMKNETFRALVANIKRDGSLGSVPLCWQRGGDTYRVLSGNHRVQAAKEAGLQKVLVLYTDRELSRQEEVAIQLSHNAIIGQDDPATLKELWQEIGEVELKLYAGLDDKTLALLDKLALGSLSEIKLDTRLVSFVFLPEELDRLDDLTKRLKELMAAKDIYLLRLAEYDRLLDALTATRDAYNVRNGATALMLILDTFERHLTDLAEGWCDGENAKHDKWVPLASIFGTANVPPAAGLVMRKALARMEAQGDVSPKALWQALEYWAADYLGAASIDSDAADHQSAESGARPGLRSEPIHGDR